MRVKSNVHAEREELDALEFARVRHATSSPDIAASAPIVNRTHRIVRARANAMRAQKSRMRTLLIPSLVSGGLLIVLSFAVWTVLDQYELNPIGLPDASQQMLVLMIWCMPLTAAFLAVVWVRRSRLKKDGNTR